MSDFANQPALRALVHARFDDYDAATVDIERYFVTEDDYVDDLIDRLIVRADAAPGGQMDLTVCIEWFEEDSCYDRQTHIAYHLDLHDIRRCEVVADDMLRRPSRTDAASAI